MKTRAELQRMSKSRLVGLLFDTLRDAKKNADKDRWAIARLEGELWTGQDRLLVALGEKRELVEVRKMDRVCGAGFKDGIRFLIDCRKGGA